MNAGQLADQLTHSSHQWGVAWPLINEATAMLRKQDASIKQLREALLSLDGVGSVIVWKDQYEKVAAAFKATLAQTPTRLTNDAELRCVVADLKSEAKEIRHQRERLIASLRAAANYVDVLGGVSKTYRQLIAEIEDSE